MAAHTKKTSSYSPRALHTSHPTCSGARSTTFPSCPRGGGALKRSVGAQTPPRAWRGRVPIRCLQGDDDITRAAGFGTFWVAVAVAGKHRAGRRAARGRLRAADAGRPGPSCRLGASSLLITLSLPLFRVYPTVLIFTAIILSQATIHPRFTEPLP